jgi:hypothetical protein
MTGGSAVFSPCRRYRYLLSRAGSSRAAGGGTVLFIMLNPSTADEARDDPTIRRCLGFVSRWGLGAAGLLVCNLFALRATEPSALRYDPDPTGPENNAWVAHAALTADRIIAAWGNNGQLNGRSKAVLELLSTLGRDVEALGTTALGEPAHPLYQPRSRTPFVYRPAT